MKTTPTTTQSLQVTDRVYYHGDLSSIIGYKNNPTAGWGTIIEVLPATTFSPLRYKIDMGANYGNVISRYKTVPHYCFNAGVGQMFFTEADWYAEIERQEKNARLNDFYKSIDREQLAIVKTSL